MISTKEQEKKALEEIRSLVAGLGKDSYLATAFDGCFEIAEQNIENDWADSLKFRLEKESREKEQLLSEKEKLKQKVTDIQKELRTLRSALEKEEEWEPAPEMLGTMTQEDYLKLRDEVSTEFYSEQEAKDLVHHLFGFEKDKIEIIRHIRSYEKNRHHRLRAIGTVNRSPVYNSSDWNYIRFNCASMSYEIVNGELHFFCC